MTAKPRRSEMHPATPRDRRGGGESDENDVPFIGRTEELRQIRDRLAGGTRLLTLSGPGGVGKTLLARRAASRLSYEDLVSTVALCELAEATTEVQIIEELAATLGIQLPEASSIERVIEGIGTFLSRRGEILLVLDNLEQVAAEIAPLIARWLALAPRLRVLTTSREALRLGSEVVVPLAGLTVDDGVALYSRLAERRGVPRSSYESQRAELEDLVKRLDGLPLAIELAAARSGILAPAQLIERLRGGLGVLRSRARDTPRRHGTMIAALEWSWALLKPWEASALSQCAVARGGWLPECAETIVDLGDIEGAPPVLDVLDSLQSKSMIWSAVAPDGSVRFHLYETTRNFALDQLMRSGAAPEVEERHARFVVEHTEALARDLDGPARQRAKLALAAERPNLALVRERFRHRDPKLCVRASLVLAALHKAQGTLLLETPLLDGTVACARDCGEPNLQIRARLMRAEATSRLGRQQQAAEDLEEATRLAEDADVALRIAVSSARGKLYEQLGRIDDALGCFERALVMARASGADRDEAAALLHIGNLALLEGRFGEASERYRDAVAKVERLGDDHLRGFALDNLGLSLLERGDLAGADHNLELAAEAHRLAGDRVAAAGVRVTQGVLRVIEGRLDEAEEILEPARDTMREAGNAWGTAYATVYLGWVHLERRELGEARAFLEEARTIASRAGFRVIEGGAMAYMAALEAEQRGALAAFRTMRRAEHILGPVMRRRAAAVVDLLWGFVSLARARRSSAHGNVKLARHHRRIARDQLSAARTRSRIAESTDVETRLLARLLEGALGEGSEPESASSWLEVGRDGAWVRAPAQELQPLSRHPVLRRLLWALTTHRIDAPGEALSPEDLLKRVWPGETLVGDSGLNRLYVAVSSLRRMGLKDLLFTRNDGYLLSPEIEIRIVGSMPPPP